MDAPHLPPFHESLPAKLRLIFAALDDHPPRLDTRVVKALRLFQSQLAKPWYLTELASVVNVCERQLERLFQEELHLTPLQCLTHLRLAQAASLLFTTKLEIKEICEQVGYHDASQFSAAFKRLFGQTPRKYRQQVTKRIQI